LGDLIFSAILFALGISSLLHFRAFTAVVFLGLFLLLHNAIDLLVSISSKWLLPVVLRIELPQEENTSWTSTLFSVSSLFAGVMNLTVAVAGSALILMFCRSLQIAHEDWLWPMASAANIAVCLCLLGLLLIRQARAATMGQVLQSLETAIVFEELEPEQIRTIFESRIAGELPTKWISRLKTSFDQELTSASRLVESVAGEVSSLRNNKIAMDDYSDKDEARAACILRSIEVPFERLSGELRALELQVPQLLLPLATGDASSGIRTVLDTWKQLNASFAALARKADPVITNLEAVLDETDSRVRRIARKAMDSEHV